VPSFDYEGKLWGAHEVKPSPTFLGGLRLRYCLDDLEYVRGRVLEIGCGAGAMVRAIKTFRPDLEVHGCDISWWAIEEGVQRDGEVSYVLGDAHGLPIASDCYDAVVVLDVLEHLPDPKSVLVEIHRVLAPGGVFHLFTPCEGDLRTLHGLLRLIGWRAKEKHIGHIQHFTPSGLLSLLEEIDFRVQNGRWSGHSINQVVDVAYFTWIDVTGRKVPASVEGYLERTEEGLRHELIRLAKNLVAATTFYESRLLRRLPGFGMHLYCIKSNKIDSMWGKQDD